MDYASGPLPSQHVIVAPERNKSSHWFRNLVSIPSSRTLQRIWAHLSAILATACVVMLHMHFWPDNLLWLVKGLSTTIHSLVGGALGLLLVFRTNSAYDRFWEARKIWSTMISTLRECSRLAHTSLVGWDREHVLQLLAAFPPILLQHLRSGRSKGSERQKQALLELLPATDVNIIWRSRHRPLTVCRMIAAILHVAFTDEKHVLAAQPYARRCEGSDLTSLQLNLIMADVKANRALGESCVGCLTGVISNSERIVKTSVPAAYSAHTSRFLSVWCFSLPLVLIEPLGWRMLPCVALVCWALLSIEEVGNTIEDPFNMPFLFKGPPYRDELKLERSFRWVVCVCARARVLCADSAPNFAQIFAQSCWRQRRQVRPCRAAWQSRV